MPFEIETGKYEVYVDGNNGFIKRKNKEIPLTSLEFNKIELQNNDTVISGSKTKICVSTEYDKENTLIKTYKERTSMKIPRVSIQIFMGPNSEIKVNNIENWEKNENHERMYGRSIGNIKLIKGFFSISLSNIKEPILTPVCSIYSESSVSIMLDVLEDKVYASQIGSEKVSFTNLKTKKSFLAKSKMPEEIIITKDTIYRKGMTHLDNIFNQKLAIFMALQQSIKSNIKIDVEKLKKQTMEDTFDINESLAGLEAMKNMTGEDLKRLMKMSGQKLTPEMEKKLDEVPIMKKKMEELNMSEEIKKNMALMKGYKEKMNKETTNKYLDMVHDVNLKADEKTKKFTKEIELMLEKPRKYDPLTKEFGAVKVG